MSRFIKMETVLQHECKSLLDIQEGCQIQVPKAQTLT